MSCVQRVKTTIESLSVAYGPTWQGETCLRQVGKDERMAGMDKWRCTERGISQKTNRLYAPPAEGISAKPRKTEI